VKLVSALAFLVIAIAFASLNPARAQNGDEIRRRSAPSVIFITVKSHANLDGADQDIQTGSGFIIAENGHALTSFHLFPDLQTATIDSIEVVTEREPLSPQLADIVRLEAQDDLALIKIRGTRQWPSLCLGDSNATPLEAWLYALGYTDAREPILTSTVGRLTNTAGNRWQTDLALNPGNSGAPVFNGLGHVVGIVASGKLDQQLMSYVVPAHSGYDLRQRAGGRECAAARLSVKAEPDQQKAGPSTTALDAEAEEAGPILVPPGGRKRFSVKTGSSAELTEESIVLAVRDPDLQRNSTAVKVAGRSTRMGIGQEVDLSLYGKNKCRLSLLGVKAEAIDFLMKCQ
jgi:hypothetical protein